MIQCEIGNSVTINDETVSTFRNNTIGLGIGKLNNDSIDNLCTSLILIFSCRDLPDLRWYEPAANGKQSRYAEYRLTLTLASHIWFYSVGLNYDSFRAERHCQ